MSHEIGTERADVDKRVSIALELIDKAGREALIIQQTLGERDVARKSTNLANIVTVGDLKVKEILVEGIKRNFPQDSIYSEESVGQFLSNGEFSWRIDEIDGTIGYRHGFPEWAISIGLEKSGTIIFGILDFPALGRRFAAILGKGATENGRPIKTSNFTRLDEVIVYTAGSWLRSAAELEEKVHPFTNAFAGIVQAVYSEPCGAMTMARLARGEIGVFLHTGGLGTKDDLGAGPLIIREAGGVHSPIDVDRDRQTFLAAANKDLYDQVVNLLGPELVGRINLPI